MADGGGGASGASFSSDREGRNRITAGENTDRSSADLDGAFLLQLLRNPPQSQPKTSVAFLPHESLHPNRDPAVAAVGPSYPFAPHSFVRPPPLDHFPETLHFPPPRTSSIPPGFHRDHWVPPGFPPLGTNQQNSQFQRSQQVFRGDFGTHSAPSSNDLRGNSVYSQRDGVSSKNLGLRGRGERSMLNPRMGSRSSADSSLAEVGYWQKGHPIQSHVPVDRNHYQGEKGRSAPSGNHRHVAVPRPGMFERGRPLGSLQKPRAVEEWVPLNEKRDGKHNAGKGEDNRREEHNQSALQRKLLGSHESDRDVHRRSQPSRQLDQSGGAFGRNRGLIEGLDIKRSLDVSQHDIVEEGDIFEAKRHMEQGECSGFASRKGDCRDLDSFCRDSDSLAEQLEDSLMLRDDPVDNNVVRHSNSSRAKDVRLDLFRGHHISSQRVRIRRREMECRCDVESLTPSFLSIYKSLIPADEEKGKQKQLLLSLGELVNKEWPNAQLHLYGSCANSFGFSNSDIDICLAIDDSNMSKPEILLKLADILQSDNLQNVQALTHARVPIVKMMDPVTGISCDICINNLLAVINTKLLRDYAQIDDRLRQLAFIVKHWAKSRGVNETYRGTLSSYAYVIMCIHFLQLRKPAILPCLQEMEATYVVTVDDTQCAYFDQVDRLRNFGAPNKESIARLLWGFFHYWAYYHDYTNDVISVRTGRIISKRVKDWTRRIGNDRHLICIEDPFETSHDLGRVVDKYSIKVLREEFERAADILQHDPNPGVTLFEPYVPRSAPKGLQSD